MTEAGTEGAKIDSLKRSNLAGFKKVAGAMLALGGEVRRGAAREIPLTFPMGVGAFPPR
jgi:hypothetical protein